MRHIWVSAVVLGACAGELRGPEDEVAEVSAAGIAQNGIAQNGIAQNSLLANPAASDILIGTPLGLLNQNAYANAQLADPLARIALRYVVSCALKPGQRITVFDTRPSPVYGPETYEGQLGICPAWLSGLPDKECQEQVSACLAARVNAFPVAATPGLGIRVLLSMRAENFANPALWDGPAPEVAPLDSYELDNAQVDSVRGCASKQIGWLRDCDWSVDRIGTCVPGTSVAVSTYQYGGKTTGPSVLRACDGVHACDATPPAQFPSAKRALAVTHAPLNGADQIEFACPASGRFSVMVGAASSADKVAIVTGAKLKDGLFPAPEGWTAAQRAVLTWPEGHFFGNMFGRANFDPGWSGPWCDPVTYKCNAGKPFAGESAFAHMYACSSEVWSNGAAYLRQRLCAGQRTNCPALTLGKCTQVCALRDGPQRLGDYNYQLCVGADRVTYKSGITTNLDDPCAIVGSTSPTCATVCGPDPSSCG
ncbi:MAG TPA: hypothetical protein VKE22_20365 [Haliangiales bacterium]|nr:hypothetical protein [Haliangiales bacterium]